MNNYFFTLINNIDEDENAAIKLLQIFEPLLKKYSYKLAYEDAYNDLQLFLLELIKKLRINSLDKTDDKYYLSYIRNSVRHKYIELSEKQKKLSQMNIDIDIPEMEFEDILDTNAYEIDDYKSVLFSDLKSVLTDNEYSIIYMLYYENYTVSELARIKKTSRQYINQCKLKALEKLKIYLKE